MKSQFYIASLVLCVASQTAFADLVITEVVSTPGGANVLLQPMDWWELTNTGPSAASLDGFEWIDRDVTNNQSSVFPTGVSIASGESIIILRDGTQLGSFQPGVEAAFRSDWGLSPSVQILMENTFTGLSTFSGLGGGANGELIHLYDGPPPTLGTASLLSSAPTGTAAAGVSFEWGTNNGGALGQLSVAGQNGAISLADGRIASPGFASLATLGPRTLFADTFELSAASLPVEPNINAEMALPRQHLATSGYTPIGPGVVIDQDPFGAGTGDWLNLSVDNAFSGSVVHPNTDFAPSVAGKRYSVSYDSRMDIPVGSTVDFWQGFSVADDFAPNSVTDPFTDFGIIFRPSGDWTLWLDGTIAVGSGVGELGIDTGIRNGEFFNVEFIFDETLASPTVTATITTATLGSVVLGTIALDAFGPGTGFEDISRFYELRTFLNGAAALPGDVYNNRYDNLTVTELGPAVSLTADFNEDGVVDAADLAVWESGFGTGTTLAEGDADADGDVDGQDFLLWQSNLGTSAISAATAVPEPAGCALVMIALAVGAGMRRSRLVAATSH